jgi:hypothetical protein
VPGTVAGESEIDSSTLWGWLPSLTLPDNVAGYHADIKGAEIVTAVEEATDAGHHPHCITETGIGTRTTLSTGSGMRGRGGEGRGMEEVGDSNIQHRACHHNRRMRTRLWESDQNRSTVMCFLYRQLSYPSQRHCLPTYSVTEISTSTSPLLREPVSTVRVL